jgi:formylglycine-generating enzyme required for sulfatase activity
MPATQPEPRYDVFISYRRGAANGLALLLQTHLNKHGVAAFLDRDLRRGVFDQPLLRRIADSPTFLIVLTPNSLDQCSDPEDWLRKEIVQAIGTGRNIIPLLIDSFQFNPQNLDPAVRELSRYNAVRYSHDYFESTIERIVRIVEEDKAERVAAQEAEAAEEKRRADERFKEQKREAERQSAEGEAREQTKREAEAKERAKQEEWTRWRLADHATLRHLRNPRWATLMLVAIALVAGGLWFANPGSRHGNREDGLNYVWIPPGNFNMGCSSNDNQCDLDETPSHPVTITKGFWLGQTPVTQASYQRVMNANPSDFRGEQLPVDSVTWNQGKAYCEAAGGRLPTEAEWEYAARAGSDTPRYGDLDAIGWYDKNSGNKTHEVGKKHPNQWNLYDMLGNVLEWVNDWYDPKYYAKSPAVDPKGPTGPKEYRVVRGGAWNYDAGHLRSSDRVRGVPDRMYNYVGFRCARDDTSPTSDHGKDMPPPLSFPTVSRPQVTTSPTPMLPRKGVSETHDQSINIAARTTKANPKDGQKYVWIPPGPFQMGCSKGDSECDRNEQPHPVTITKGFWLEQTPVTNAAYQRIMGKPPSHFHGDQLPVERVAWNQAKSYCEAVGGRLPTEAEWEYAARANNHGPRYGDLSAIAWWAGNSDHHTHEVGLKQANKWELYDMLGNVWQWTADLYDEEYYAHSPLNDPKGPAAAEKGDIRVIRGGSWFSDSNYLRVSNRDWHEPLVKSDYVGFRCVREVLP